MEEQTITLLKECNSGCNMGIQSVSECMNKCRAASHGSIYVAKKLVKCEEKLMEDVKKFL